MDISAYQHMNIRMSTRGKRPLRNLTPSDKVRAIQRIHNGETKASVSRDIGVPESTLRGWCKNEQKLRFMCRQVNGSDQLGVMAGMDTSPSSSSLPDKRNRYESHIKTPQYPVTSSSSYDDYNFNRVAMNGLHYGTTGSNAILEKIAFNEIMKQHGLPSPSNVDNGNNKKVTSPSTNPLPSGAIGSMPLGSDYAQLSILQNINLLSLLNPTLAALPTNFMPGNSSEHSSTTTTTMATANGSNGGNGDNGSNYANGFMGATTSGLGGDNIKSDAAPLPLHITADDMIMDSPKSTTTTNNNFNNNSNNNNNSHSNYNNNNASAMALTVKDWAKDPAKDDLGAMVKVINGDNTNSHIESEENNGNNNKNDSNNNSVNDKRNNNNNNNNKTIDQMNGALENGNIEPLNFLPPLPFPFLQRPTSSNIANTAVTDTTEKANAAMLEWYKIFNASLNFLVLATASAALQPANNNIMAGILTGNDINNGQINGLNMNGNHQQQNDNNNSNDSTEANILYKELTKNANRQLEAITNNALPIQNLTNSDTSNDSYFESEPEDLSVRSAATSKLSSPINSYTQSPVQIKSSDSCSPHSLGTNGDQ